MKEIVSAGFIVYSTTDKEPLFLILQYAGGHWDFAKGKVEPGESLQEAALRELYEETGLKAGEINPNFRYSFDYTFVDYNGLLAHKEVVLFLTKVSTQTILLSHEHQGFKWLVYQEASDLLTYSNAQEALKNGYCFIRDNDLLLSDY